MLDFVWLYSLIGEHGAPRKIVILLAQLFQEFCIGIRIDITDEVLESLFQKNTPFPVVRAKKADTDSI